MRRLPAVIYEGGLSTFLMLFANPFKDYYGWQAISMARFSYVYELVSNGDKAIRYRGITQDLKGRLQKHNPGGCRHTAKYRPRRVEVAVAFRSELKARAFEKYLKRGSGREFSRRHF